MMIIGCDFHPSWQQVSWLDTEMGETGEQKLVQALGDAERFYRQIPAPALIDGSHGQLSLAGGFAQRTESRVVGGRCGPDSCQLCAAAEDRQAGCGAHSEAAGGRTVSAHLDAVFGGAGSAATAAASSQTGDHTGAGEERVATPVPQSGSAEEAQAL